jgi:hypothetical protein
MALGPGIPLPPPRLPAPLQAYRHRIPEHLQGVARLILGGLHHEYQLEEKTALRWQRYYCGAQRREEPAIAR